MFNQPALSTEDVTSMMETLAQTFEEGRFNVTIGQLTALIDDTRDEDGNEVFHIVAGKEGGIALAFELDGRQHEVRLHIRPNPSNQTFTF